MPPRGSLRPSPRATGRLPRLGGDADRDGGSGLRPERAGASDAPTAQPTRVREHGARPARAWTSTPTRCSPPTTSGYGFDNVGDVLSLPPVLLEKYLLAAEQIAALAIVDLDPGSPPVTALRRPGPRGAGRGPVARAGAVGPLEQRRGPRRRTRCRATGATGSAPTPSASRRARSPPAWSSAWTAAPWPVFDVRAERDAPEAYEVVARPCTAGAHRVGAAFVNDYYMPQAADPRAARPEPLRPRRGGRGADRRAAAHGLPGAAPAPHPRRRERTSEPAADVRRGPRARGRGAAPSRRGGDRAPRRRRDGRGGAARGTRPHGPHRPARLPPLRVPRGGGARGTGAEPATAHGSPAGRRGSPTSSGAACRTTELIALADAGRLGDPAVLEAQAVRMLRDARATALAEGFAAQWLKLGELTALRPGPRALPGRRRGAPRRHARRRHSLFFEAVLREDRDVRELLAADFTFVNERLGDALRASRASAARTCGASRSPRGAAAASCAQASVLTATSNPDRTSPVKRGKWILETLLDRPPPPPPAERRRPRRDGGAAHGRLRPRAAGAPPRRPGVRGLPRRAWTRSASRSSTTTASGAGAPGRGARDRRLRRAARRPRARRAPADLVAILAAGRRRSRGRWRSTS